MNFIADFVNIVVADNRVVVNAVFNRIFVCVGVVGNSHNQIIAIFKSVIGYACHLVGEFNLAELLAILESIIADGCNAAVKID